MEKNNLNWKITSMPSWVTVLNTEGSGDRSLKINVENASGYTTDVTGTVVVSCTSCENPISSGITVCRCSCDCNNLGITPTIQTMDESGLTADSKIAEYNLLSRCSKNLITAEIVNGTTHEKSQLTCENGYIKLNNSIPYNEYSNDIIHTVIIYFDKNNNPNSCDSFTIRQKGIVCNCRETVAGRITYSDYFTNNGTKIPQSGLTVNTELFRYSLKEHCPENLFTAEIKYASTTRSVNISGGIAKLGQAIGSYSGKGERTITLTIKYNDQTCETETKNAYQIGCGCDEFFDGEESFTVEISTFGETTGNTIGNYRKKSNTTCPDSAITASLSLNNGEIIYPLICSNGNVVLGGENNIDENISHNDKSFLLTVYYDDVECDTATTYQKGVACNCDDISGKVTNFIVIPKTGLTVNSKLAEYRIDNPNCSTDNNCLKIRETHGYVEVGLSGGNVYNKTVIGENDDNVKGYVFEILYNVNNKWRLCDSATTYQQGLACSCESIHIEGEEEEEFATFPLNGTNGLTKFAVADTGLYKNKGTEQEELFDICGSLSAISNNISVIEHSGNTVITSGIPLTAEEIEKGFTMPHKYEFYIDLGQCKDPITSGECTSKQRLCADLFFIPKDGSEIKQCTGKALCFIYDPNACNCEITQFIPNRGGIPCEGYTTQSQQLGTVQISHTEMTLTAELLQDGQEYDICAGSVTGAVVNSTMISLYGVGGLLIYTFDASDYVQLQQGERINRVSVNNGNLVIQIYPSWREVTIRLSELLEGKKFTKNGETLITDFSARTSQQRFYISGKVPMNETTDDREVGVVRIHYWCNKGTLREWYCGCSDAAIVQNKGCVCNCDYVNDKKYSWIDIDFQNDSTTAETLISEVGPISDCVYLYLEDTDEDGYATVGGWCKVKVYKKSEDNKWYLYAELINNEHQNITGSVTVCYAYLKGYDETTGDKIYEKCGEMESEITDTACDCNALNDNYFNDITVTIEANETTGSSSYGSSLFNVDDCIQLYIDDNGTPTGYNENNRYEYKENGETIFNAYISGTYTKYIVVSLERGKRLYSTKTYQFTVRARYMIDNETYSDPCSKYSVVTVKQKFCTCNDFFDKLTTFDNFYYDQTDTDNTTELTVARLNSDCGVTLLINHGNKTYCAADFGTSTWPQELNYITGMPQLGSKGDIILEVKTLTEGEYEDNKRETNITIVLWDRHSTDKCQLGECGVPFTITETWEYNCDAAEYGIDYNFSFDDYNESDIINIPCGGANHMYIAKYKTPPTCFTVRPTSQLFKVTVNPEINGEYTLIYVDAQEASTTETGYINIEVSKNGVVCDDNHKIKIQLC